MNQRDPDGEHRRLVLRYGNGECAADELPLEDVAFWHYVLAASARPGRSSDRARFLVAAAEHLLRRQLEEPAADARTTAAVDLLSHSNPRVRRLAAHLLVGPLPTAFLPRIAEAVHDYDSEVALQAVRILASQDSDEAARTLTAVLAHSSDLRSILAGEALTALGGRAVPFLAPLLDSEDPRARRRAVGCLVKVGDAAALPLLLRALHDDSSDIAWLAADGLLDLGQAVRHDVLRSLLDKPLTAATLRAVRHYAEHAAPRKLFNPIVEASSGLASATAVLVAVKDALDALPAPRSNRKARALGDLRP